MLSTSFRQLQPHEFPLAKKFYKQFSRSTRTNREDLVYVAEFESRIAGCLRVASVHNYPFLRGVFIDPDLQGQGIGSRLIQFTLHNANLNQVWTFPYTHLVPLYAKLGFNRSDQSDVPKPLKEAFDQYRKQGRKIDIMHWQRSELPESF